MEARRAVLLLRGRVAALEDRLWRAYCDLDRATKGSEHRVVWQRRGWRKAKARTVGTRAAADTMVDKLLGDAAGFDGLAPLEVVRVDRRTCGPWTVDHWIVDDGDPRW